MFSNNLIAGAAGQSTGFYNFPLEQSLRFNDDDSAYLSWTPASAGNRKTWTWSGWVKKTEIISSGDRQLFGSDSSGGAEFNGIAFISTNALNFRFNDSGSLQLRTSALFRDTSAWYHIVVAVDTTQATPANRMKLYINGSEVTDFISSNYPSQNAESSINSTQVHEIGRRAEDSSQYFDGYLAEVNFIDGTSLDADSFGELKSGVWIPKDPSGLTYGTNGFRLSFADDAEVEAFNTVLWKGNTVSGTSITGMGFQPDFVWIRGREGRSHALYDAVRGTTKPLSSDTTAAEGSNSEGLQSFDSDGFTLGSDSSVNNASFTYVGWGWKAGDSNVSNTDGSINSTVRANDTYGFSIVSYTGDASTNATVGHGLSSAPAFVIVKNRDQADDWKVGHQSLTAPSMVTLNQTYSVGNSSWVTPTSSVIGVATASDQYLNQNNEDYIAYCWAEKAGYSKFGSYTGSRTSGQTVTCGFRPAFLLVKNIAQSGSQGNWMIVDGTRETVNSRGTNILYPNDSVSESTIGSDDLFDFTDTGFNVLNTGDATAITAQMNGEGDTIIYAAFADTREAAFWLDQSGNDNDWQPVNLDHNDTVADSPTDNFATWNPLDRSANTEQITLSDGNLSATISASQGGATVTGTIGVDSGKYYYEFTVTGIPSSNTDYPAIGWVALEAVSDTHYLFTQSTSGAVGYRKDGAVVKNNSTVATFNSFTTGDVIGVAYDADTGKIWFAKNGTWQGSGDPAAGTNEATTELGLRLPALSLFDQASGTVNFGQQPFKYDPPA